MIFFITANTIVGITFINLERESNKEMKYSPSQIIK